MDLDRLKKEALKSGNAEKLKGLAGSEEVRRIGMTLDTQKLKSAVQSGDERTLGEMMQQVLATSDGQKLLKTLEDSFGKK